MDSSLTGALPHVHYTAIGEMSRQALLELQLA
jgi:hypothetical protein